jgi:murein L,D-transpeptidase YcbB/YkuD
MEVCWARKFVIAAAIAASFLLVGPSDAAQRDRDAPGVRTCDFFCRLFGGDRSRKRPDNSYRKRGSGYDEGYFFTRPVKRKDVQRQRDLDPTPEVQERAEPPLVYQPEKLETLRAALPEVAPDGVLPAAIYGELNGKNSTIRATAGERKALVDFYRQNGFRPLWVSTEGLGERGRSVLRLFQAAADDGMSPEDYLPSRAEFFDGVAFTDQDMDLLASLDLELSARALRYARHASGGRIVPDQLTKYYDITPQTVDLAIAMHALQRSPDPAAYLKSLQPSHPAYAIFKKALAGLHELKGDAKPELIEPGEPINAGQEDPDVALVRRALAVLGYGETEALSGEEAILDGSFSETLRTFQADARIRQTGALDAATIQALKDRTGSAAISRLVYNMERLRWLPKSLGERHVFVNQAAYSLKVVDDGRVIWRTKVIVGKPNSQTVAFSDNMERVVFNPTWGVPPSMMKNDMIPKLRRDPGYLDRLGYRVLIPGSRKIVRSRSINWGMYRNGKVPFLVLQPPGDDNALGELKFLFPNAHDIYMHDTPTRDLFKKEVRAFSHGCVRVENPRDFAELLLGMDQSEIAARIDSGETQETPITRATAVHLTYFTDWPADDGRLITYDDIYGRDERMARAFSTVAVASR